MFIGTKRYKVGERANERASRDGSEVLPERPRGRAERVRGADVVLELREGRDGLVRAMQARHAGVLERREAFGGRRAASQQRADPARPPLVHVRAQ